MLRRDLRHKLIDGDSVVILPRTLRIDLRAGQPRIRADMGLAQSVRMVESTEEGEVVLMLLQRL